MMTRKDFRVIAQALAAVVPDTYEEHPSTKQWEECVNSVANALRNYYPNFNRDQFVMACLVERAV